MVDPYIPAVPHQEIMKMPFAYFRFLFFDRKHIHFFLRPGETGISQWTSAARRIFRDALPRSEFHDGLVMCAGILAIDQGGGQLQELLFPLCGIDRCFYPE